MKPRFYVQSFGSMAEVDVWLNQLWELAEAAGLEVRVEGFTTDDSAYYVIARTVRP